MRHSLFVRSIVLLGAVGMMGGFVYWRAFAARPMPGDFSPGEAQGAHAPGKPEFDPLLMPGSKSAILIEPSSGGYPGADVPPGDVLTTADVPLPADLIHPGAPAVMPPRIANPSAKVLAPAPPSQPTAPSATTRRQFLPGSKSMILPELLPTQPSAVQRPEEEVQRQQRAAPNPPSQPRAQQSSR